jgi:tetratricopeptide (TPR) repeat protein
MHPEPTPTVQPAAAPAAPLDYAALVVWLGRLLAQYDDPARRAASEHRSGFRRSLRDMRALYELLTGTGSPAPQRSPAEVRLLLAVGLNTWSPPDLPADVPPPDLFAQVAGAALWPFVIVSPLRLPVLWQTVLLHMLGYELKTLLYQQHARYHRDTAAPEVALALRAALEHPDHAPGIARLLHDLRGQEGQTALQAVSDIRAGDKPLHAPAGTRFVHLLTTVLNEHKTDLAAAIAQPDHPLRGEIWRRLRGAQNEAAAHIQRAEEAYAAGDYNQAISEYTQAIVFQPDSAEAFFGRGLAYNRRRNYRQAISDLTRAIRLRPDYAAAYHHRGTAYGYVGEDRKSTMDLRKARNLGYRQRG